MITPAHNTDTETIKPILDEAPRAPDLYLRVFPT